MTIERSSEKCPGFGADTTCFRITYSLPSGTQLSYHPHPHTPYASTKRQCYLPDTVEGIYLLQRLKYAFNHGLIFDVGTSLTTGKTNQIIWSTIPHKTSIHHPTAPFSFPIRTISLILTPSWTMRVSRAATTTTARIFYWDDHRVSGRTCMTTQGRGNSDQRKHKKEKP
jgi:hypothetical protein